jgi:hypothetical protein
MMATCQHNGYRMFWHFLSLGRSKFAKYRYDTAELLILLAIGQQFPVRKHSNRWKHSEAFLNSFKVTSLGFVLAQNGTRISPKTANNPCKNRTTDLGITCHRRRTLLAYIGVELAHFFKHLRFAFGLSKRFLHYSRFPALHC